MVTINKNYAESKVVVGALSIVAGLFIALPLRMPKAPAWQEIATKACERALTSDVLEAYVRKELQGLRVHWQKVFADWQKKWNFEGKKIEEVMSKFALLPKKARKELVDIPFYIACASEISVEDEEILAHVVACSDAHAQGFYEKMSGNSEVAWGVAVDERTGWFMALDKALFIRDHDENIGEDSKMFGLKILGTIWHEMMHVLQHANALALCRLFGYDEKSEGPVLLTNEDAYTASSDIFRQRHMFDGEEEVGHLWSRVIALEHEADTKSVEYFPNKAAYAACSAYKNEADYHKSESEGYLSNDTCIEIAKKNMGQKDEAEYKEFCKKFESERK